MTQTVAEALAIAVDRLRPRFPGASHRDLSLEAEVLLAYVLHWTRAQLLARDDHSLGRVERARFTELVRRRRQRVPSAYLRGEQEFWSLSFVVGPGVLVPRPETEILVEQTIALASPTVRILDVGTGSGAIAIALARELPQARIVAIDLSDAALTFARRNALRHELESRIEFFRGDLRSPDARWADREYDIVVSNPPYVEMAAIRDEIAHEPSLALIGDGDPFPEVYRALGRLVLRLAPTGSLLVEVGAGQADEVAKTLRSATSFPIIQCVRDAAGIPRCVIARC